MSLIDTRQTIIDTLKEAFGSQVRQVIAHRGQFENLKEIQNIALKAPALLVCYRGFKNAHRYNGEVTANVQWVVYILTRDQRGADRNETADALNQKLIQLLPDNDWGLNAENPEQIDGRNLSSLAIDKAGACLWAVTWTQKMSWDDEYITSIDNWLTYHADHYDENDSEHLMASDTVELTLDTSGGETS